jgi:hypothetical protein
LHFAPALPLAVIATHQCQVVDNHQLQAPEFANQTPAFDAQVTRPHRGPIQNFEGECLELALRFLESLFFIVVQSATRGAEGVDLSFAPQRPEPHLVGGLLQREERNRHAGGGNVESDVKGKRAFSNGGARAEHG